MTTRVSRVREEWKVIHANVVYVGLIINSIGANYYYPALHAWVTFRIKLMLTC